MFIFQGVGYMWFLSTVLLKDKATYISKAWQKQGISKNLSSHVFPPKKNTHFTKNTKLVGGWTNPFEKYARQISSFPQGSGWKLKKHLSCQHLGPRPKGSLQTNIFHVTTSGAKKPSTPYKGCQMFPPSPLRLLVGFQVGRMIPWNDQGRLSVPNLAQWHLQWYTKRHL